MDILTQGFDFLMAHTKQPDQLTIGSVSIDILYDQETESREIDYGGLNIDNYLEVTCKTADLPEFRINDTAQFKGTIYKILEVRHGNSLSIIRLVI